MLGVCTNRVCHLGLLAEHLKVKTSTQLQGGEDGLVQGDLLEGCTKTPLKQKILMSTNIS